MKVLLFEYVAGGGWWEVSSAPPAGGLLAEGRAMLEAAAQDFAAVPGVELTVFRDARLPVELPASAAEFAITSLAMLHSEFRRVVCSVDAVLVIAPETDGALARFASLAASGGARLLGPSVEFITLAADKQQTADALHRAGVAVPCGVVWPPGRPWPMPDALPDGLAYPLVWKPLDGCGSTDVRLIAGPDDELAPPESGRLEEFIPGRPASCLVLCGDGRRLPLPPCRQMLSSDGRFQLLGLELLDSPALIQRVQQLATQAVAALPPCRGLVGVDLVLGEDRDVAIEINPRLTTSYVLMREAIEDNLAALMLDVAAGQLPAAISLTSSTRSLFAIAESEHAPEGSGGTRLA